MSMDDYHRPGNINFIPDHFQATIPDSGSPQSSASSLSQPSFENSTRSNNLSWSQRKLRSVAFRLNMFSLRRLSWGSSSEGQEKVVLTAAEVESLRSEVNDLEEKEAHLKAQIEHIHEILLSARLSGYLYMRTRWPELPGEPLPVDDTDVDDWLPRFVVLQGPCIFYYLLCTDPSPQDSTLLSDIVEIGILPSITREDAEIRYAFFILTRQGLRFECSSISKIQVNSWLLALRTDCKLGTKTQLAPLA